MHCINVKAYAHRLQDLCRIRRKKKQVLKISAPFNFKKEESILPGVSDDEISILREKAAASRIGIADFRVGLGLHHSHTYSHQPLNHHHHQRRLPPPSALSARRGGSLCLNPVDRDALPGGRTSPNVLGIGVDNDYSSTASTRVCRCGGVAASERSVSPQGSFLMLEKEMSL